MKRLLNILLISVITTTRLQPACSDEVNVPDAALKDVLQQILKRKGVKKETLEAEDLATINYLNGRARNIADLTGLEHCVELQEVRLDDNKINDVTPLAACVKMKSLDLSSNQIESIEPLKSLVELRYLNIEANAVQKIDCVKSMNELTSLFASSNRIADISPLKDRTRLHSLYLAENKVADLSAVSTLKSLASLDVRKNQVVDVKPLKPLKRLRWTFLSDNKVADITPLADMAARDNDRAFAPYWRVYLEGNPLAEDSEQQVQALKTAGVTVRLNSPPPTPEAAEKLPSTDAPEPAEEENDAE